MNYSTVSSSNRHPSPIVSSVHHRTKTQYLSSYTTPYRYDYLNSNQDYYLNRKDILMELEEQKLSTQRSNIIIEELLEDKKKREKEREQERRREIQRERERKELAKQIAYHREQMLKSDRSEFRENRQSDKYQQRRQDRVKTEFSPQKKSTTTKDQIMTKLYDQPSPQAPTQKQASFYTNNLTKNIQKSEIEIMKEEIKFLKNQLAAKNTTIVDLQCQVVRLQKVQQLMSELQADQVNQEGSEEEQSPKKRIVSKDLLAIESKCTNVMIQSRKYLKNKLKAIDMVNFVVIPTKRKYEDQTIQTINNRPIQSYERSSQTNEPESDIKIQLSSNILSYSIGQQQVDFLLTNSYPLKQKTNQIEQINKGIEVQTQTESGRRYNRESQTFHRPVLDREAQSDRLITQTNECQTTNNQISQKNIQTQPHPNQNIQTQTTQHPVCEKTSQTNLTQIQSTECQTSQKILITQQSQTQQITKLNYESQTISKQICRSNNQCQTLTKQIRRSTNQSQTIYRRVAEKNSQTDCSERFNVLSQTQTNQIKREIRESQTIEKVQSERCIQTNHIDQQNTECQTPSKEQYESESQTNCIDQETSECQTPSKVHSQRQMQTLLISRQNSECQTPTRIQSQRQIQTNRIDIENSECQTPNRLQSSRDIQTLQVVSESSECQTLDLQPEKVEQELECEVIEEIIKKEYSEVEMQTDQMQKHNEESQTSDNYYDYIQNTYLEWMFEKEYKEMEARKKEAESKK